MAHESTGEKIMRQRFTDRLRAWWPETDDVSDLVDELMEDLGYAPKPVSLRKADPIAYEIANREYQRAYQQTRRRRKKLMELSAQPNNNVTA